MFTTEEAFEASTDGEPILMTRRAAERLIDQHQPGDDRAEFWNQHNGATHIDAALVLAWLGY